MRSESSSSLHQSPSPTDQKTTDLAQQQLKAISSDSPSASKQIQHLPKASGDLSDFNPTIPPLTLQALADGNSASKQLESSLRFKNTLERMAETEPKAKNDDIAKLSSTEPMFYEVLKCLQNQTESITLPSIDILRTQWVISKVFIATAIAQVFMNEPDREKNHNFDTLINVCKGVHDMIKWQDGNARSAHKIVDVQSKFQALSQLINGFAQEKEANPSLALSLALPHILSQIVTRNDLEQVKEYSERFGRR